MQPFGQTVDGRSARLFTLQNSSGFRADISDYGGAIVRLLAPDREGRLADVVLGLSSAADYEHHRAYLGTLIGRYGNRIARGKFKLEGREYELAANNSPSGLPCHLHGGRVGFDRALWEATTVTGAGGPALRLRHRSPDGDEGYPGNLEVEVTYTVTADNALQIDYQATTDRATPVNLTNHVYFNLGGEGLGDVLSHEVVLQATHYTPVNAGMIPTGEIAPVAGTPLDFRSPHAIGQRINDDHLQLKLGQGYDHNFVIDGKEGELKRTAQVREPLSGRTLEVLTTEPGVQFYTGNFLDGSFSGKNGHRYDRRTGFCLETQHFPDSPNQPAFPSTILRPGQTLRSKTIYRFGAR